MSAVTEAARKLLQEALSLPEDDRAEIIDALQASLTPRTSDLSSDWKTEIQSRIEQLESDGVQPIPWEEVDAEIRRILARER